MRGGALVPTLFVATINHDKWVEELRIALRAGAVKELAVDPPNAPNPDRIPVTDAHQKANKVLKPYEHSGINSVPPSFRASVSDLIWSSEWHSTKNEKQGVKEKACFTVLSVQSTDWPPIEKRARLIDPSSPGP